MNLHVYPTDRRWFDFLRDRPDIDEVNFWQPGGTRVWNLLRPGELLLFRLKSPVNMIAGGGVFVHSSVYPVGLAWEAFGQKNGTPSHEDFRRKIAEYKGFAAPDLMPDDATIGCIVLQAPFFLPESQWLPVPTSYSANLVQGKRYDATQGPGRELFEAILSALVAAPRTRVAEPSIIGPTYGEPILAKRRIGQGAFRVLVTDLYDRRCAVTGEKTLPVLQAAHIKPVSKGGHHRADNGLLFRSDIHTLFDLGYVSVTPDFKFEVSAALRDRYSNGRVYYDLAGASVRLPNRMEAAPAREFLEWHHETVFRR